MKTLLTVVALLAMATPASAGLLIDENFDYTTGVDLLGQNTGEATWGDLITFPGQGANRHKITSGNVTVPGLPAPAPGSNSVTIPNTPNSIITRIPLPGAPYTPDGTADGPSLFFSFSFQLTNATPTTGADYFFAGFHWNGQTGGFGSSPAYGYQLHLQPSVGTPGEYELGVSKNNAGGSSIVWDTVNTFKPGQSMFVVGEYNFAGPVSPSGTDDVARLWVSKTAVNNTAAGSPTAVQPNGPDVNAGGARLQSFWLRSDTDVSGDLVIDNLRIGTEFSNVTVPEPATFVLAGLGLAAVGLLRRKR
jgi:hypothetical protein